jgi:hypothetical protein
MRTTIGSTSHGWVVARMVQEGSIRPVSSRPADRCLAGGPSSIPAPPPVASGSDRRQRPCAAALRSLGQAGRPAPQADRVGSSRWRRPARSSGHSRHRRRRWPRPPPGQELTNPDWFGHAQPSTSRRVGAIAARSSLANRLGVADDTGEGGVQVEGAQPHRHAALLEQQANAGDGRGDAGASSPVRCLDPERSVHSRRAARGVPAGRANRRQGGHPGPRPGTGGMNQSRGSAGPAIPFRVFEDQATQDDGLVRLQRSHHPHPPLRPACTARVGRRPGEHAGYRWSTMQVRVRVTPSTTWMRETISRPS